MKYLKKVNPLFWIITFFFVLLFLYSKVVGSFPLSIISTVTKKTDVFTVTGEGKTVAKPDLAYVSIGIEGTGATVKEVQNQINNIMAKVMGAFKKLGIDEEDIQTTNYSIQPTYDWSSGKQRITGYSASTQLKVKVKDIDKINEVIDTGTANGANQIGSISFDVEDKEKVEETARKEAVAQAKAKAEAAAKAAGFKLGKIIGYSESSEGTPQPIAFDRGALKTAESTVPGTDIQVGSSEIKITVSLSYQIK